MAWRFATLAAYLGISKGLLYKLIRSTQVPHYGIGKRILINEEQLLAWRSK
ncbi:MAG: helix-turn-helix domain-containing protein [Spirochaetia bacterium]